MIFASDLPATLTSVAAVIGAVAVLVYNVRSTRRVNTRVEGVEAQATANRATAVDAKQTASLAGAAAIVAANRGVPESIVDEFRRTIEHQHVQLVEMARSTSQQLDRSNDALVECERHRAEDAIEKAAMRAEIAGLRTDVATLTRMVAAQAPGLVKPPESG
jgi:hypothetical protein